MAYAPYGPWWWFREWMASLGTFLSLKVQCHFSLWHHVESFVRPPKPTAQVPWPTALGALGWLSLKVTWCPDKAKAKPRKPVPAPAAARLLRPNHQVWRTSRMFGVVLFVFFNLAKHMVHGSFCSSRLLGCLLPHTILFFSFPLQCRLHLFSPSSLDSSLNVFCHKLPPSVGYVNSKPPQSTPFSPNSKMWPFSGKALARPSMAQLPAKDFIFA